MDFLFVALLALAAVVVAVVVIVWLRRPAVKSAPVGPEAEEEADRERSLGLPVDAPREGEAGTEPAPAPEPVRFTVYHPPELTPERWSKLLAYVHLAGALEAVERDRERALAGEPGEHRERTEEALVPIRRESSIQVVPELPGCRFNPPRGSVLWVEDFHCVPFKVQAHPGAPGYEPGRAVNGRVAFYVESVLVGEVPIWALLADRAGPAEEPPRQSDPVAAYERVFASYSHDDGEIVSALGRAYQALGMTFLRDVEDLRSGEEWNPRLLELIESADVFQLYWSASASASRYVAQEWRHALEQRRERFVRPVYWRKPMPPPPDELGSIHFAFLPGYDGEEG